jgi:hypothetical protein
MVPPSIGTVKSLTLVNLQSTSTIAILTPFLPNLAAGSGLHTAVVSSVA